MIRTLAATLVVAAFPATALAQQAQQNEFEGLDLSGEQKKDEGKVPSGDEPLVPKGSTPDPMDTPKKPVADGTAAIVGERDITQEDRVKSVQKKLYLKKGRFELAPYIGMSVNDPYYTKYGGAIRAAYYLADTLAISLRGTYFLTYPTEDVRTAKRAFLARIFPSVPLWSGMADVEWSPIYGKVSFLNSILHFDAYVLGGAGVVSTETSLQLGGTLKAAADVGLGSRFVVKDFLAVNVALINTTFVDQPAGTTKGITQNLQMLYAGVSLFFPFKSTFREAE